MTDMETTETVTEPAEQEFELAPAADLDDLFANEEPEDFEPEIPEGLSDDELRARLVAAEKRANFERTQRLQTARKTWAQEAKEHFPYSSPEKIKADSRRTFLEEAKAQDAEFRAKAEPLLTKTTKTEEEIRAEIRAELEAEAERSFGRPTVGTGRTSTEAASQEDTDKRLESARKKRDLNGAVAALMDGRRI